MTHYTILTIKQQILIPKNCSLSIVLTATDQKPQKIIKKVILLSITLTFRQCDGKLKKSLYGLKQSPRCWNRAFTESLKSLNFTQSHAEPCIFIRRSSDEAELSIIALYVDDLIIVATTEAEMDEIKASLRQNFKMTDMGSLHFCLGVSIKQISCLNDMNLTMQIQSLHQWT